MDDPLVPQERVVSKIFFIRGQKVILDSDIAELYGVETKRLNEQVKRNVERFPGDFMFRLTQKEKSELVANCDRFNVLKHSTVLPYAFTEQGVAMLASVLRSKKAVDMSIFIVRTFVRLRELMHSNVELAVRIEKLERGSQEHKEIITEIYELINKLISYDKQEDEKSIGFQVD